VTDLRPDEAGRPDDEVFDDAGLDAAAFRALLGQRGGVVVLVIDERLRIVRAGVQAAILADRDEAQLTGMSLIAAFGSADLDAIARQATASGETATGEATLGRARERTFAVDAVPLTVDDGPPITVMALHDVTALRRVERVRRDFVANISHELRTPLASIKLLAETLSSGAVDDPTTARDFTGQIERETDHLAQLVDELLDLSMIESGETVLAIEAHDPSRIVDDIADRIRPVAQRRGVTVVRDPAPPDGAAVRAAADAMRLGQAILNLAHNAVKYSHPGGTVRLGWQPIDGRVRFVVIDDGIGIPAAHQQRIFERFYKVDRARTADRSETPASEAIGGSAGLGLAIVRHIAEAHGGAVGLASEEGAGSTFWIEVPAA
jgi:two-component system phosphate regulon sensor histidine kinase PhoR